MSLLSNANAPNHGKPVVAQLPPREAYTSTFDEQGQSSFFSNLPAEIRNEIYNYAFQSGARELLSVEAHPLSLLLTCRKVYHEASTIAFSQHTFPLCTSPKFVTFVSMRNAKSHLSLQQIQAVTALSYDLRRNYGCKYLGFEATTVLANAILVFPNLQRFELRILRGRKTSEDIHCGYILGTCVADQRDVARKYLPHWFSSSILQGMVGSRVYSWQTGERWKVELPQAEDDTYLEVLEEMDTAGNRWLAPFMSPDAIGNVRGVRMCPCHCGNVEWTSADIVQETGRRIAIDTVYYGPEDRQCPDPALEAAVKARLAPKKIVLKEGMQPLDVAPGVSRDDQVTHVGYEADEEYWERLRRNNGDWRTLCKLAWQLLTSTTPEERFPGSKALGEGDWASMADAAEPNTDPGARGEVEVVRDQTGELSRV